MRATLSSVDENDIAYLKDQWNELLTFYAVEKSVKNNTFRILQAKYSEDTRFYHNLSHIKFLLTLYESLQNQIQERSAVRFSIWFHDVMYDTKRNDNEEASARLASEVLEKLSVNTKIIELVTEMILATKSHNGQNLSEDAKLFLDMDLAILGMSKDIYEKYNNAIRAEYAWVPEETFRTGRRKILQNFIERDRIYFTDEMQTRFEEQARRNINGEIQSLIDA